MFLELDLFIVHVCSYGPMFIGVMLNIMLYGVMITQTYLYFTMYKE